MANLWFLFNLVLPNLNRSRRQLSNDTKIVKFGQNLVQKFLISQILTWVLGFINSTDSQRLASGVLMSRSFHGKIGRMARWRPPNLPGLLNFAALGGWVCGGQNGFFAAGQGVGSGSRSPAQRKTHEKKPFWFWKLIIVFVLILTFSKQNYCNFQHFIKFEYFTNSKKIIQFVLWIQNRSKSKSFFIFEVEPVQNHWSSVYIIIIINHPHSSLMSFWVWKVTSLIFTLNCLYLDDFLKVLMVVQSFGNQQIKFKLLVHHFRNDSIDL